MTIKYACGVISKDELFSCQLCPECDDTDTNGFNIIEQSEPAKDEIIKYIVKIISKFDNLYVLLSGLDLNILDCLKTIQTSNMGGDHGVTNYFVSSLAIDHSDRGYIERESFILLKISTKDTIWLIKKYWHSIDREVNTIVYASEHTTTFTNFISPFLQKTQELLLSESCFAANNLHSGICFSLATDTVSKLQALCIDAEGIIKTH